MARSQVDQSGCLAFRFLPDSINADLGNNLQAGTRRFQRGYVGGPIHEAKWRLAVARGSDFEPKRILMRKPAGEFWLQLSSQVRTDVQIADARASAQPFQNATAG